MHHSFCAAMAFLAAHLVVGSAAAAPISRGNMPAYCRGEASGLYNVRPRYVKTARIVKTRDGFQIAGTVDLGSQGKRRFACLYDSARNFVNVQSMTDEGKL